MFGTRLRLGLGLSACLVSAASILPTVAIRADHGSAPVVVEDFEGGLGAWAGVGQGAGSWTTLVDPQSPSPAKTVLANADGQSGAHAAYWTTVTVDETFRLEARLKGTVSGGWVGLTLGHRISPTRYLAARVQVGGRRAELIKYPEGTVIASGNLPSAGGCADDPTIPAGQFVRITLEVDDASIIHISYEGTQIAAMPLPTELMGGGHPGVYYAGGASRFEDVTLQGFSAAPTLSADVTVNAAQSIHPVPDELFGAFMVWLAESNGFKLGNVSWDSARDNFERLYELFPMIAELGIRTLRFNGGKLANTYLWKEHVGPHDEWSLAQEISLDNFMLVAESLGARPIVNVNASDSPIFGLGTYFGARYAADMVEYLTVPDDGSNPHPDGLAPDDPDNIDWARLRADHGHIEPFPVLGFEVGNELRGPPYLNGTPASTAYANRFVEFAGAMKAVNPNIAVGAVGKDNHLDADFADWYQTLHNTFGATNCDWVPGDGVDVQCADFWIRHVLVPSPSAPTLNSVGVTFDKDGGGIDVSFEVAEAGNYRIAIAAYAAGLLGTWPQIDVSVDEGATFGQVLDVLNNGPAHPAWPDMRIYETANFALTAGTHTLNLTRIGGGAGHKSLLLYPIASLRDGAGTEVSRVDLKDSRTLGELLQATSAATQPGILAPQSSGPGLVFGRPIIVTETSLNYESFNGNTAIPAQDHYVSPMDPRAGDLRETLMHANLYRMLMGEGVGALTALQLFDDEFATGLIEGVGKDTPHGGEVGWDRIGTSNPPRYRPRGYLMREMARHWWGRDVVMTSVSSPTYATGGEGIVFGKVGTGALASVPYVTATGTLDAAGDTLSVTLVNTHGSEAVRAKVTLQGFTPQAVVARTILTGDGPGANNEPEGDVCSHPAGPGEPCDFGVVPDAGIEISAESKVVVDMPANSIAFIQLDAAGADTTAPGAPSSLNASPTPDGSGVLLSWTSGGGGPATYDVYRSVHFEPSDPTTEQNSDALETPCLGPFRYKLNSAPLASTTFIDTAIDGGRVYCYGVRAVDASGNESPVTALRYRPTVQTVLGPETISLNYGTQILYGTTLANTAVDLPPIGGVEQDADFLILLPNLAIPIPPLGKNLDVTIASEPFTGDPSRIRSMRLVYASRFYQALVLAKADLYLKNFAKGGVWESFKRIESSYTFNKDERAIRTAHAEDYLSPQNRFELRIDTNAGGYYARFYIEHLRFEVESL